MKYTIYKITNKINGKIYIGKHQTKDVNDGYMGSGKYLKRAIEKHGLENFVKDVLHVFDSEEQMNAKEAELVTEKFCLREDTYNICVGGKGGFSYINYHVLTPEKRREGLKTAISVVKEKYGVLPGQLEKSRKINSLRSKNLHASGVFVKSYFKRGEKEHRRVLAQTEEARAKRKNTFERIEHQQGTKNSQHGTTWITNGERNKKIKIGDNVPDMWFKGRTMKKNNDGHI